jgi:hypothetical protein
MFSLSFKKIKFVIYGFALLCSLSALATTTTTKGAFIFALGESNNRLGSAPLLHAEDAYINLLKLGYDSKDIVFLANEETDKTVIKPYKFYLPDSANDVLVRIKDRYVFENHLISKLKEYDNILIYISSHGGSGDFDLGIWDSGNSSLTLFKYQQLSYLINEHAKNKKVTLVLQPCFSGSFFETTKIIDASIDLTVLTAAGADSYAVLDKFASMSLVFFSEIGLGRNLENAFKAAQYNLRKLSKGNGSDLYLYSRTKDSKCFAGLPTCDNNDFLLFPSDFKAENGSIKLE